MTNRNEHFETCKHDGGINRIHNHMRDLLIQMAQKVSVSCDREPPGILTGKRPDFVFYDFGSSPLGTLFDVSLTTPYCGNQTGKQPGIAATHRYIQKEKKFLEDSRKAAYDFVPIVFETLGYIHPKALEVIKELTPRSEDEEWTPPTWASSTYTGSSD